MTPEEQKILDRMNKLQTKRIFSQNGQVKADNCIINGRIRS